MLFIRLRASNAIALILVLLAFYLNLRGISLATAWQALSSRGNRAAKAATGFVKTQMPEPEPNPNPKTPPPMLDPRLKNANQSTPDS